MKALVVRNPWAWCIGQASINPQAKTVENRIWSTRHRGELAIITGRKVDRVALDHPLIRATVDFWTGGDLVMGVPPWEVGDGAVTAVVDLYDICGYGPDFPELDCDCGDPWAVAGQFHWRLRGVRRLVEPAPVLGRLGLFDLPGDVEAAVTAGLGEKTERTPQ